MFTNLGMMMANFPLTGEYRKDGKLVPRDTFVKSLERLLKPFVNEDEITIADLDDPDPDANVIKFHPSDKRRIKFRKMLTRMGIPFKEINTHSYRKGAGTYVRCYVCQFMSVIKQRMCDILRQRMSAILHSHACHPIMSSTDTLPLEVHKDLLSSLFVCGRDGSSEES